VKFTAEQCNYDNDTVPWRVIQVLHATVLRRVEDDLAAPSSKDRVLDGQSDTDCLSTRETLSARGGSYGLVQGFNLQRDSNALTVRDAALGPWHNGCPVGAPWREMDRWTEW